MWHFAGWQREWKGGCWSSYWGGVAAVATAVTGSRLGRGCLLYFVDGARRRDGKGGTAPVDEVGQPARDASSPQERALGVCTVPRTRRPSARRLCPVAAAAGRRRGHPAA